MSPRFAASLLILVSLFAGPTCLLGAAATQAVPPDLQTSEEAHVAAYRRIAPAVVGLSCKAPQPDGQEGGYYGTGAVISADGLVLTNVTVIPQGAKEVKVYFTDKRVLPAEVVRIDPASEGALVKVAASGLAHMKLADSQACRPGDPAYSWGNPHFTIQRDGVVSLSLGTVSGQYLAGSPDDQSRYAGPVLETDAAVNPGSDGGPLTDAEGNLLGIMSLAFSRTRWLGLAIPVHRLAEGLPELQALPRAKRAELTAEHAKVWGPSVAFGEAAKAAAEATVGVWVVREGEADPPANRKEEKVEPQPPLPRQGRAQLEARRPPGAGSGFLLAEPGYALTSAFHVQDEGSGDKTKKVTAIHLYFVDGRRVPASLVAADAYHDLALLKFEPPAGAPKGLELVPDPGLAQGRAVAVLGRSEPPGDWTLNSGTVSAMKRRGNSMAQISALINYGNLGGPVINLDGKAIGMAALLHPKTTWRQNCGVGFVLLADKALELLPKLKAGQSIAPPKQALLGVQAAPAGDEAGAKIGGVLPKSAADAAGLLAGDLIVALNGKEIGSFVELAREVGACEPGQEVKLKVVRNGETLELSLTLGAREQP